jgi:hypothetical protein
MEPAGAAGYVIVASAAVLALFLGALGGTIAWAVKRGPLGGGVAAIGVYLATRVVLESASLTSSAVIGIPPMIMTLLTSWLTASYLEARTRSGRMWAALLGLACALLLGFLWGFLFRLGFRAPVSVAIAADVCLIGLLLYQRKSESSRVKGHVTRPRLP